MCHNSYVATQNNDGLSILNRSFGSQTRVVNWLVDNSVDTDMHIHMYVPPSNDQNESMENVWRKTGVSDDRVYHLCLSTNQNQKDTCSASASRTLWYHLHLARIQAQVRSRRFSFCEPIEMDLEK